MPGGPFPPVPTPADATTAEQGRTRPSSPTVTLPSGVNLANAARSRAVVSGSRSPVRYPPSGTSDRCTDCDKVLSSRSFSAVSGATCSSSVLAMSARWVGVVSGAAAANARSMTATSSASRFLQARRMTCTCSKLRVPAAHPARVRGSASTSSRPVSTRLDAHAGLQRASARSHADIDTAPSAEYSPVRSTRSVSRQIANVNCTSAARASSSASAASEPAVSGVTSAAASTMRPVARTS